MALNFTKEFISETSRSELQALNKFEQSQYGELISLGIQIIMEPEKAAAAQDSLQQFSSAHGVNLTILKTITKTLLIILKAAVRRNVSPSQLKDDMLELGISEEKAAYLADQGQPLIPRRLKDCMRQKIIKRWWQQNLNAISHAALKRTLTVNQLVDMEWKFGVTASSSEVNKVGSTFLQLKLVINKGNKMENVYMELSLPQFYSFLHEMEKAKSSLEYLT